MPNLLYVPGLSPQRLGHDLVDDVPLLSYTSRMKEKAVVMVLVQYRIIFTYWSTIWSVTAVPSSDRAEARQTAVSWRAWGCGVDVQGILPWNAPIGAPGTRYFHFPRTSTMYGSYFHATQLRNWVKRHWETGSCESAQLSHHMGLTNATICFHTSLIV